MHRGPCEFTSKTSIISKEAGIGRTLVLKNDHIVNPIRKNNTLTAHKAIGKQVHQALVQKGAVAATAIAEEIGQPDLFERVRAVASETPVPNFLHSALCAMSLPVRCPQDDQLPIIRQDGQYTLVITPKPVVIRIDDKQELRSLGVPYGTMPRLILIHVMTEAVRTKSRRIVLGNNLTDWMRSMGFKTFSYGPRGSATLLREQLDRLLACEWMIRWDSNNAKGEHEFGIREIKLSNEYVGTDRKTGSFMREIYMTEGFFGHLKDHAVPLNEMAIRQLKESATSLDLYTWLAYRLPRIDGSKPLTISWPQLAVHFGNDGKNVRKFRQTIRDAWDRNVSAVYPEAIAEFGTAFIKLHASPPPLHQKPIRGLTLISGTDANGTPNLGQKKTGKLKPTIPTPELGSIPQTFMVALRQGLSPTDARTWLRDSSLDQIDGEWTLMAETRFVASWLSTQFDLAIRKAATAAGITGAVKVRARPISS